MIDTRLRPLAFLQRMRERHGDLFDLRTAGGRLLIVADPELARQVFAAPGDELSAGEGNRRVLGEVLGEHSVILLDGEPHMEHRRQLLAALHGPRLERHAEAMRALAAAHLDAWPRGEPLRALPRLRALALAVVLCALFGRPTEGKGGATVHDALAGLLLPAWEPEGEDGATPDPVPRAEELIGEEVARRGRGRSPGGDDVLSALLEPGDGNDRLSQAEVRDELMTMIVAGTETTAGSLAWALERLARAPEALARVAREAPDGGGPYTDAAIQETPRSRRRCACGPPCRCRHGSSNSPSGWATACCRRARWRPSARC